MGQDLSPKQERILHYIDQFTEKNGFPPTLREICRRFRISSTNGARYHLHKLGEKGYLKISRYTSRGVTRRGAEARSAKPQFRMPILGRVPAGPTDYAAPDIREGDVIVDPDFFGRRSGVDLFGLRVKGDSMIEAGIHSGDVVVVHPQPDAHDGDVVVARMEDEATVKTYRRRGNQIFLEPANPSYQPIVVNADNPDREDVVVVGVVVGLIRAF
ncbi:MAG TPA: transcriptional repressor LexA [bacterium]|nr:transcriptional repressor LexA [bacterium]HQO35497.1 transcriptional repressor LexA [bacterium]HQP98181.1 transcriptional repressor LexA [bacterium]